MLTFEARGAGVGAVLAVIGLLGLVGAACVPEVPPPTTSTTTSTTSTTTSTTSTTTSTTLPAQVPAFTFERTSDALDATFLAESAPFTAPVTGTVTATARFNCSTGSSFVTQVSVTLLGSPPGGSAPVASLATPFGFSCNVTFPLQVSYSGVMESGDTLQFSAPGLNSAATVSFSVRGELGVAPTQVL